EFFFATRTASNQEQNVPTYSWGEYPRTSASHSLSGRVSENERGSSAAGAGFLTGSGAEPVGARRARSEGRPASRPPPLLLPVRPAVGRRGSDPPDEPGDDDDRHDVRDHEEE